MKKVTKGSKVANFATRSERLAHTLMKELQMQQSIIESFKGGTVQKTNYVSHHTIFQSELMEEDNKVISNLKKNGLLVYHVLSSLGMEGQAVDIECEHTVSTFENLTTRKSFLCVPTDIYSEALKDEEVSEEYNRKEVIKNYIEHAFFMAKQGHVFSYNIKKEVDDGEFAYIEISEINGNLLNN